MAAIDVDFSHSESSEDRSLSETEEANDLLRVNLVNAPYQNEPMALGPQGDDDLAREENDEDGLSLATIEARYDRVETVAQWFELQFYFFVFCCQISKTPVSDYLRMSFLAFEKFSSGRFD